MFFSGYKKAKKAEEGFQEMGKNVYDNDFVRKVDRRIRRKGGDNIHYSFELTYRLIIASSYLFMILAYSIIHNYYPDTEIGQFLYTRFHDLENIKWTFFGASIKALFYAIMYEMVYFLFFGICISIRHLSIRLFFDFLGQCFIHGFKSGSILGILFFLFFYLT